jgi:hypothetical protein
MTTGVDIAASAAGFLWRLCTRSSGRTRSVLEAAGVASPFSHDELECFDKFRLGAQYRALGAFRKVLKWRGLSPSAGTCLIMLMVSGSLFALAVIAAALEHELGPAHHPVSPGTGMVRQGRSDIPQSVPLLRDYAYLTVLFLGGFAAATFAREWDRLDRLPGLLARGGLLRADRASTQAFVAAFQQLERTSCQLRWEVLSIAGALATVGLAAWSVLERGVYSLLDPYGERHRHAAALNLEKWWADPHTSKLAFGVVLLAAVVYMYLTLRNTIMGAHALVWFRHIRREAGGDWFGYSGAWCPYELALAEVRQALLDVFVVILIGAIAGAASVYALAVPPQLVSILLIYLIYNSAVFVVPWVHLNKQLGNSKSELRDRLVRAIETASQSERETDRETTQVLWMAYRRTGEFPDRVIQRVPVGALVAVYLIPIIGLIPSYIR